MSTTLPLPPKPLAVDRMSHLPLPPGAFGQPPQGQFAGGPPPQQQPGGFGGFPGPQPQPPRPATVSIDDAFSELSVSGPPPPPPEPFRAGEQVLYTDSQGRNFPAEVVKVRHKRRRKACDEGRHRHDETWTACIGMTHQPKRTEQNRTRQESQATSLLFSSSSTLCPVAGRPPRPHLLSFTSLSLSALSRHLRCTWTTILPTTPSASWAAGRSVRPTTTTSSVVQRLLLLSLSRAGLLLPDRRRSSRGPRPRQLTPSRTSVRRRGMGWPCRAPPTPRPHASTRSAGPLPRLPEVRERQWWDGYGPTEPSVPWPWPLTTCMSLGCRDHHTSGPVLLAFTVQQCTLADTDVDVSALYVWCLQAQCRLPRSPTTPSHSHSPGYVLHTP